MWMKCAMTANGPEWGKGLAPAVKSRPTSLRLLQIANHTYSSLEKLSPQGRRSKSLVSQSVKSKPPQPYTFHILPGRGIKRNLNTATR